MRAPSRSLQKGSRRREFLLLARRHWRKIRASYRDTLILLREFRLPLLLFALTVVGSGWLYFVLSQGTSQPVSDIAEAMYIALTMTFLNPVINFPHVWYLQVFFFLLPVVGISILAQGLTDFGVMLFNRRARGKEWEMAVASTFSNHIVLIGLGHLGFRVVKNLIGLGQDVVVIERSPEADLLHSVRALNVAVIEDDGTRETVLTSAGIQRARAVILCTQNDSLNLRMALKARALNPHIEVIMRIFDDEFAQSLENQFGFHAMSATGMAAPLFASIAAKIDMTPPISIDGQPHILAQMPIGPRSPLRGLSVFDLEERFRLSVVMLCHDGDRHFHPASGEIIQSGQTLALFGAPEQIYQLLYENKR